MTDPLVVTLSNSPHHRHNNSNRTNSVLSTSSCSFSWRFALVYSAINIIMFGRLSTRIPVLVDAFSTSGMQNLVVRHQRQGNPTTRLFQHSSKAKTMSSIQPKARPVALNTTNDIYNPSEKIINLHTIPLEELETIIVSLGRECPVPFVERSRTTSGDTYWLTESFLHGYRCTCIIVVSQ